MKIKGNQIMDNAKLAERIKEMEAQGKRGLEIYKQVVLEGVEEKMRERIEFVLTEVQVQTFRAYLAAILFFCYGITLDTASQAVARAEVVCNTAEKGTMKDICKMAFYLMDTMTAERKDSTTKDTKPLPRGTKPLPRGTKPLPRGTKEDKDV